MTTVAIMQPHYLPWLGYFDLLDQADVFVLLDTVAVSKQSWQTRNRIRARDGNVVWLSVPTNATPGMPLNEVRIDNTKQWQAKHMRSLESAYGHAPYWESVVEALRIGDAERPLGSQARLSQTNTFLTVSLGDALFVGSRGTKLVMASTLADTRADPIHRIADICTEVGASEYLSPIGAKDYMGDADIGVPIRWHDYRHPVYDQGGAPFVSHLSVVDLLAWHGPDSLGIIRSGRHVV